MNTCSILHSGLQVLLWVSTGPLVATFLLRGSPCNAVWPSSRIRKHHFTVSLVCFPDLLLPEGRLGGVDRGSESPLRSQRRPVGGIWERKERRCEGARPCCGIFFPLGSDHLTSAVFSVTGWQVDYLRSRRLGGAAVWTLDMDDFSGRFCGHGKYPLISHLRQRLSQGGTFTYSGHVFHYLLSSKEKAFDKCKIKTINRFNF